MWTFRPAQSLVPRFGRGVAYHEDLVPGYVRFKVPFGVIGEAGLRTDDNEDDDESVEDATWDDMSNEAHPAFCCVEVEELPVLEVGACCCEGVAAVVALGKAAARYE